AGSYELLDGFGAVFDLGRRGEGFFDLAENVGDGSSCQLCDYALFVWEVSVQAADGHACHGRHAVGGEGFVPEVFENSSTRVEQTVEGESCPGLLRHFL